MSQVVDKLISGLSLTHDIIVSGQFEQHCFAFQSNIVTTQIQPDIQRIKSFQRQCATLESLIDKVFEKRTITYRDDEIYRFVSYMRRQFPEFGYKFDKIVANREINVDHLFFTFELASPMIVEHVMAQPQRNVASLKYELGAVERLAQRSSATYYNLLKVERSVSLRHEGLLDIERKRNIARTPRASQLQSMMLATPPMHYHAVQSAQRIPVCPRRISLSENIGGKRTDGVSKLTAISENLVLLTPVHRPSSTPNTTVSPLRIGDAFDPTQILRSLEKKKKNRRPPRKFLSSSLARLKWPADNVANSTVDSNHPAATMDFSSTLNETSASEANGVADTTVTITGTPPSSKATAHLKRLSIRQHYKSLDGEEINSSYKHRSPSGRIDALYNKHDCDTNNLVKIRPFTLDIPTNQVSQSIYLPHFHLCSDSFYLYFFFLCCTLHSQWQHHHHLLTNMLDIRTFHLQRSLYRTT